MVTVKRKVITTPIVKGKKSHSVTNQAVLCDHCGETIPDPDTHALNVRCKICGRHTCTNCRIDEGKKYPIICKHCSDQNPRIKQLVIEHKHVYEAQDVLTNLSIRLSNELNSLGWLGGKAKYEGIDPF